MPVPPLPRPIWQAVVERALADDLGRAGDITTDAIISPETTAAAAVVARADGRIAGLEIATAVFGLLDERVEVVLEVADGDDANAMQTLATVRGPARAILSGERVALNFLGHLSGVATTVRQVVRAIEGTGAAVAETRKTTPGLRALEKYAVRCGGGSNHRYGLDDAVLIKDNHIAVAGGVGGAIDAAKAYVGHLVKIEVEVDTLEQLAEALEHRPDVVLLDNMEPHELRRAVAMIEGRAVAEASGGIRPDNAREIAETGVDVLSMGWLTHSAPNLDVALDIIL
jgi:nicotinate-nucleotide pyrophosphorylase (carboxylating)